MNRAILLLISFTAYGISWILPFLIFNYIKKERLHQTIFSIQEFSKYRRKALRSLYIFLLLSMAFLDFTFVSGIAFVVAVVIYLPAPILHLMNKRMDRAKRISILHLPQIITLTSILILIPLMTILEGEALGSIIFLILLFSTIGWRKLLVKYVFTEGNISLITGDL